MSLLSPDADDCENADESRSGEVETGGLCSGRRLFFISRTARGSPRGACSGSARAGRETGESLCRARGLCSRNRLPSARGGGRTGFSRDAKVAEYTLNCLSVAHGKCAVGITRIVFARVTPQKSLKLLSTRNGERKFPQAWRAMIVSW